MGFSLKSKVGSPDSASTVLVSDININIISLIFGILILILGIVDMIVLYVIPNNIIKENKRKYPDSSFEKPKSAVIGIHFTLHSLIILLGIILIICSFDFVSNIDEIMIILMITTLCLIFIFWIVALVVGFTQIRYHKSKMSGDEISSIIKTDPPINSIFIYTTGKIRVEKCTYKDNKRKCQYEYKTCYSRKGVSIPVQSHFLNDPNSFNYSELPDMFYLKVRQEINMSTRLRANYNKIVDMAYSCDKGHTVVNENYPQIEGTYIVTSKKLPTGLKSSTRIASIIFGVGVYYEMYSKSLPTLDYIQKVDADVVETTNYDSVWINCNNYGACLRSNSKPKP